MVTQNQLPMTPLSRVDEPDMGTGLIDPTRYTSHEFAQLEWDRMWTKTWNIAGPLCDIAEVGDYFTHTLGRESFIFMHTGENEFSGYYNVCPHRGSRIRPSVGVGHAEQLQCPFHLWDVQHRGRASERARSPALRERHPRGEAAPDRGSRRHVGGLPLVQHGRRGGIAAGIPGRDAHAPRSVSLRGVPPGPGLPAGVGLQLEVRGRPVRRDLPPAGAAPAADRVVGHGGYAAGRVRQRQAQPPADPPGLPRRRRLDG